MVYAARILKYVSFVPLSSDFSYGNDSRGSSFSATPSRGGPGGGYPPSRPGSILGPSQYSGPPPPPSPHPHPSSSGPEPPVDVSQRPKLVLLKRQTADAVEGGNGGATMEPALEDGSVPTPTGGDGSQPLARSKSNPFGSARPVDTAAKLKVGRGPHEGA